MNLFKKYSLALSRILMGWFFLYAGLTKIFDPSWSAKSYIENSSNLTSFYSWLAGPANIEWVSFLNEWGLTLIGIALILGVLTRLASFSGIILMLLYYFPVLDFPYAGEYSFLVNDHIIYALILTLFIAYRAGLYFGLDAQLYEKWGNKKWFPRLFS